MSRTSALRRLAIALTAGMMFTAMSVATAGRALADDPGLEQDGGGDGGGGGWSWDPAYGVSFFDPSDGVSITDPGYTDIPSVTGIVPPPPAPVFTPNPPSCPMNSVPGFLPGDTLPAGQTFQIFVDGVPENGWYSCETDILGPALWYVEPTPTGGTVSTLVPPED